MLQQSEFDRAVGLGHADSAAEAAQRLGRIAAAADSRQRGHARIVPSAHVALLHQLQQLALAEQRISDVQAVEFDLLRMVNAERIHVPVVERPVVFEFQRADRVGDAFDGVGLPVREVVHRINAPFAPGTVMVGVQNAIHHRVAQVEIGRRHVDFGAQRARAIGKLAGLHALEQIEILFHRAIAIGALFARLGEGAARLAHFFGAQIANEGFAVADHLQRPFVELAEVVGSVVQAIPLEPQPAHVLHDGIDVFGLFLARVGIVEAQIGLAAELVGQSEIQADGFGVAQVQIAVGLGGKARVHAASELAGLQIVEDDIANEVRGTARR